MNNNDLRITNGMSVQTNTRTQALRMMRDRGIDDAEALLRDSEPQVIIRTCEWFDRQSNARKGLLVWKIRAGGVVEEDQPVSKAARMRDVFNQYVAAHPVDSRLCSHMALAARKWPDDEEDCPGQMIVAAAFFPVLEFVCDGCGFWASLTPRAMRGVL